MMTTRHGRRNSESTRRRKSVNWEASKRFNVSSQRGEKRILAHVEKKPPLLGQARGVLLCEVALEITPGLVEEHLHSSPAIEEVLHFRRQLRTTREFGRELRHEPELRLKPAPTSSIFEIHPIDPVSVLRQHDGKHTEESCILMSGGEPREQRI